MTTVKTWEILHIPDKPPVPTGQHPTVDVIASIVEPKFVNTLVRLLSPLENLRHVKRVQKNSVKAGEVQLSVILCLAHDNENQLGNMPDDVLLLLKAYQLSPFITKVSKYAASTKEEWEEQCKHWPTSYHPPTYNIDGITGFSEEDAKSICNYMKAALELAKSGPQVVNAAIIVDPSVRQVISSATDQTCSWHTQTYDINFDTNRDQPEISACHQSDAKGEAVNDALPPVCARDELKRSYTDVSCLYPLKWKERRLYSGNTCSWHPLRHAALVAIEYSAARDRHLFPGSGNSHDLSAQVDDLPASFTSLPAKRQKIHLLKDENDVVMKGCCNGSHSEVEKPYLCTGCDIYLVWEPCTMCAMALVHQRMRRIFYAFPNPNSGALGSVERLQGEKSLNHHYAVFRVMVPAQLIDEVASDGSC